MTDAEREDGGGAAAAGAEDEPGLIVGPGVLIPDPGEPGTYAAIVYDWSTDSFHVFRRGTKEVKASPKPGGGVTGGRDAPQEARP